MELRLRPNTERWGKHMDYVDLNTHLVTLDARYPALKVCTKVATFMNQSQKQKQINRRQKRLREREKQITAMAESSEVGGALLAGPSFVLTRA